MPRSLKYAFTDESLKNNLTISNIYVNLLYYLRDLGYDRVVWIVGIEDILQFKYGLMPHESYKAKDMQQVDYIGDLLSAAM